MEYLVGVKKNFGAEGTEKEKPLKILSKKCQKGAYNTKMGGANKGEGAGEGGGIKNF